MTKKHTNSINHIQPEIKSFAIALSILLHLVLFLLPIYYASKEQKIRTVGIKDGKKTAQIFLLKKSEIRGQDLNLSTLNPMGRIDGNSTVKSSFNPSTSLKSFSISNSNSKLGNGREKINIAPDLDNILLQKIKGSDIQIPQGVRFSERSRHAFEGATYDVGIVMPEGVSEDRLNRHEEMFYSFNKRIVEQYINQILIFATTFENRYPRSSFPWTNTTQRLRAKLTYDIEGNLQRITFTKKADGKILQEYYQEVMHNMNKIPNPPQAIINKDNNFELTFGLNIIE